MISTLLDDFIGYLGSTRSLSKKTMEGYYYDIRTFLRFMKIRRGLANEENFDSIDIDDIDAEFLENIKKIDLYAFNAYLERRRDNSNRTKYRKLSAIRTFFNYLSVKINVIDHNPIEDIDMPKLEKTLPVALTLDEAIKFLNTIKHSEQSEFFKNRDYAIATLFLNCGMRLSELASINLEDIRDDKSLKIMGKGKKERTVYLNDACIKALDDYLKLRPDVEDKALFLSRLNKRIGNRGIQNMIEKHILEAGLDPNKYTVHKLRHTAATLMYRYGNADLRSLQEVLGHASVTTTQIYTHVSDEQIRTTVENNPLGKIDNEIK